MVDIHANEPFFFGDTGSSIAVGSHVVIIDLSGQRNTATYVVLGQFRLRLPLDDFTLHITICPGGCGTTCHTWPSLNEASIAVAFASRVHISPIILSLDEHVVTC